MNEYTTPLIIVTGIAAIVTLAIWLLHAYTVSTCRKELRAYKEQVVNISDKIDALKERHKLLPQLDQDFTVPMSGETLATYNAIAERLDHHRQGWLKLMDVWEQAQTLLNSEWLFGSRRARAARRHLRGAAAPTVFATVLDDCEAPLDRIEQAHAQAASDRNAYEEENRQLGVQIELVAAASLAIAPYQPDRLSAASLANQSQGLLPADPLATIRILDQARGKIAAVRRLASKILEYAAAASEIIKTQSDIQRTAAQRRAQGFLLQEEGANPDPLLETVRQLHSAIQESLNQANDNNAGTLLSKACALLEHARQGMEAHVAAKTRCESEIPSRQAEARRLTDVHALARVHYSELTRDFAAETWLGVSENVQRAEASLSAADQFTSQAVHEAMSNVQHFVRAAKLLDQAADNQRYAQTELAAVGNRLRELVAIRAAFQAQIGQLGGRTQNVGQLLQSSNADRTLANERYRTVRMMVDSLIEESRRSRPDWMRLTSRLLGIGTDLDRVEQLVREDIQLAQQSATQIAEAEKVIREARAFQDDRGVTPDLSAAESQLAQARGCLTSQGYEEAIRLANAAEQMARFAHQESVSRAQQRQQELESQRRAEQANAFVGTRMQAEAEPS